MMHVVATNSSPRMEKGNTALIMNPFLEGMKEAGVQVELVYSKELSIQPCTGEFSCWGATPCKWHIRDGMEGLLSKQE